MVNLVRVLDTVLIYLGWEFSRCNATPPWNKTLILEQTLKIRLIFNHHCNLTLSPKLATRISLNFLPYQTEMAKGRPLRSRQERRLLQIRTPTTTAYLTRRAEAISISAQGFTARMSQLKNGPGIPGDSGPATNQIIIDGGGEHYEGEGIDAPVSQLDNNDWIDESQDPLLSKLKSASYQRERLLHEQRWDSQYPLMLEAYLQLRTTTHDWSSPILWNKDFAQECNCRESQRRTRKVDLVDIICE